MENASKALIMAAGLLIGLLILSLAVYLFVSFGSTASEIYQKNEDNQLNKFNVQFTSYVGKDLTIYDVITITNLATENNLFYQLPRKLATGEDNYISVAINGKQMEMGNWGGKSSAEEWIMQDISGIKDEEGKKDLPKYTCTVKISSITKRVYLVDIINKKL